MKRIIVLALFAAVALFGVYIVITVYDDNLSVGRMWETPAIRPHEEPIPAMVDGVVPFSGGEAMLRATAAKQLKPPYEKADEGILANGKTQYRYYCIHCHGADYDGRGTVGQSFNPLPADLRSPTVQVMSAGNLFRNISYGKAGGRQPPLHTTISVRERWHIVSFIQSLDSQKSP